MTIPEINQLRKDNKTVEAYNAAKALLSKYPDDFHARSTMAWCIKNCASEAAQNADTKQFIRLLSELVPLRLGEIGEQTLTTKFAWDIMTLFKNDSIPFPALSDTADKVFAILQLLEFKKPDKYFSMLLDSFLKIKNSQNIRWGNFCSFMDWWGFDNFMPQDYCPVAIGNDKSIMSLAERAYSAYYKSLIAHIENGNTDTNAINSYLTRLDNIIHSHPEYKFAAYHKALLLLELGEKDNSLEAIRPFVKQKQNDFWVWDVLSQTTDDEETQLSCYCRALRCHPRPEYICKMRLKAAELMHRHGFDSNAKYEIEQSIATYRKKGWHIKERTLALTQQPWYVNAANAKSNNDFYEKHLQASESYLYIDSPEIPVLITYCNQAKRCCNYVTTDRKRGFFYTKNQRTKINANHVYNVRFVNTPEQDKPSQIATIKPVADSLQFIGVFYNETTGKIRIRQGSSFGFADDIFVSQQLIDAERLQDGDEIRCKAALSYNPKKQSWGWRAIHIRKQHKRPGQF